MTRFSIGHEITGAQIWTTALVLMAFGQVIARVGLLQAHRPFRSQARVTRHDPKDSDA